MKELEKKSYFWGVLGIGALLFYGFWLFFSFEKQQLDHAYRNALQEELIKIESVLNKNTTTDFSKDTTAVVHSYLEQYGYFDYDFFSYHPELQRPWQEFFHGSLGFFLLLLFLLCTWGLLGFHALYKKVDDGQALLSEIIAANQTTETKKEQWERWKKQCNARYRQGAIGRLYEEIWEVAQIVREREEAQKKEQQYLKDMMSDISHQLKTPLAALQVFLDIFKKNLHKNAAPQPASVSHRHSMEDLTEQAQFQVERMRWLVTGLLKLAQIESGALPFTYNETSLLNTLKHSIHAINLRLQEKEQRISLQGDTKICIPHDRDWLSEAFLNILKNATEYAPDNSTIDISITETSMACIIAITDRGPGIAEEELPKIFNRFYRAASNRKNDSVGIGLALSKSIIERQGGHIRVQSQTGEASFTRFEIVFLTKL